MTNPFFDTHAHLDGEDFLADLSQTLERARTAGLTDIVCVGASSGLAANAATLALVEQHGAQQPSLHATVGIHPHDAGLVDSAMWAEIERMAAQPSVVAIGETGLDYYYHHSPRGKQAEIFRASLALAGRLERPVVIHTRDAEDDTIAILREADAGAIGGVLHCFTGTAKLAQAALDLGFYLSFSGVLTFKNADPLRAIAASAPQDRVLVETDCPYLAPVPHRGQRNEPSYVLRTVEKLAELWQLPVDVVKRKTGENAMRLFRLDR